MKRKLQALFLVLWCIGILVYDAAGQIRQGKFGFGISGSGNMLKSDLKTDEAGLGASVDAVYSFEDNWGLRASLGFDTFTGKNSIGQRVFSTASHVQLGICYNFLSHEPFNPFLHVGAGLLFYYPRIDKGPALLSGNDRPWDISAIGGVGFDYFLDEFWSVTVTGEAAVMASDNLEGYASGSNDLFGRISIGVRYHLFDKDYVKRMIDTFERRGHSR